MAEEAIKALEIAPASVWRLAQSGVVLFLLQMALSIVLGMVVMLPAMALIFIPTIRAVEAGMLPSPEGVMAMMPAYFFGMLIVNLRTHRVRGVGDDARLNDAVPSELNHDGATARRT